ncbi:phage holin family protein [Cellulomonas sp. P24]|uniref:phage holin family protein n=1 Tax=Cellulomonas sp. P24 TaxID=2885206 RepID=UPI00216AC48D|nr:phage holin family protein [Cellulomonas sp. P24]MCR6492753.1 phage holin family protein [Cellulomonas sp. P24]
MTFVWRVLVNAIAIWLAQELLSGITVVDDGTTSGRVFVLIGVGLIFGLVNAVVKPIVKFFAFPLYVLTLGLFTLVVNALMLLLTAWITQQLSWGLKVDTFGTAVIGALIISVVSFILSRVGSDKRRR